MANSVTPHTNGKWQDGDMFPYDEKFDASLQILNTYEFTFSEEAEVNGVITYKDYPIKRRAIVFHELVEIYYRTSHEMERGDDAKGAHKKANDAANGRGTRYFQPMDKIVFIRKKK